MDINVIFDGNYLFHKTFSVFRSYGENSTKTSEEILSDKPTRQMFIRKIAIDMSFALNRITAKVKSVSIVFDKTSWRKSFCSLYKAKDLDKLEEDRTLFYDVMFKFAERLKKRGFCVFYEDSLEGDDLIFILSKAFQSEGEVAMIISGDRDLSQLVSSDKIFQFCNNSKDLTLFHSAEISGEKLHFMDFKDISIKGIVPTSVFLKKAILGDSGDNVKSALKGFGEKSFEAIEGLFYEFDDSDIKIQDLNNSQIVSKFKEIFSDPKLQKKFFKESGDFEVFLSKIHHNLILVRLDFTSYFDFSEIPDNIDLLAYVFSVYHKSLVEIEKYSYNLSFDLNNILNLPLKA
jgi:5'-3' exonuclease